MVAQLDGVWCAIAIPVWIPPGIIEVLSEAIAVAFGVVSGVVIVGVGVAVVGVVVRVVVVLGGWGRGRSPAAEAQGREIKSEEDEGQGKCCDEGAWCDCHTQEAHVIVDSQKRLHREPREVCRGV